MPMCRLRDPSGSTVITTQAVNPSGKRILPQPGSLKPHYRDTYSTLEPQYSSLNSLDVARFCGAPVAGGMPWTPREAG